MIRPIRVDHTNLNLIHSFFSFFPIFLLFPLVICHRVHGSIYIIYISTVRFYYKRWRCPNMSEISEKVSPIQSETGVGCDKVLITNAPGGLLIFLIQIFRGNNMRDFCFLSSFYPGHQPLFTDTHFHEFR